MKSSAEEMICHNFATKSPEFLCLEHARNTNEPWYDICRLKAD